MLLARLAVDLTWQGRGLGKALVKDALLRTAAAADIAGIRALLVHAKDDEARGWYEALEFEPSPTDPYSRACKKLISLVVGRGSSGLCGVLQDRRAHPDSVCGQTDR